MPTPMEMLALHVATWLLGGFFVVLIGGFLAVGVFAKDGTSAKRGCGYILVACLVVLLIIVTLIGDD